MYASWYGEVGPPVEQTAPPRHVRCYGCHAVKWFVKILTHGQVFYLQTTTVLAIVTSCRKYTTNETIDGGADDTLYPSLCWVIKVEITSTMP